MTFTEVAVGVEIVQAKRLTRRRILALDGEIDEQRFGWRVFDLRLRKGPFEGPAIVKAPGFAGGYLPIARLVDRAPLSRSDTQRQFFTIPAETLAVKAIGRLVASCAPDQAESIAYKVATDPDSLSVAGEILMDGLRSTTDPGAIVCGKAKQKMAGKKLAANSRAALEGSAFWGRANPSRILWTIMRAAPESARAVFTQIKKNDPNLDQFALTFLKHAFSSNGGQSYTLPDDPAVKNFVSVVALTKHAKKRLGDPDVVYPLRAAWQSVVDGKALYGKDGSDARM